MKYPRTITVLDYMDINFAVHEGELSHAPLRWNEMLGQVASLTLPNFREVDLPIFKMQTADELVSRMERLRNSNHGIWQREGSCRRPVEIAIVVHARGFDVHRGEKFAPQLCWDEMIGQLAAMTMPISIASWRHVFEMIDADKLLCGPAQAEDCCCEKGKKLRMPNLACPDCEANFGEIPR